MSFTADVKTELAAIRPQRGCCLAAQCYGMLEFAHAFCGADISLQTEHAAVAATYSELVAACCSVAPPAVVESKRRGAFYTVSVREPWERRRVLERYGHAVGEPSVRLNRANLDCDGCAPALLRGAFLVCGAVSNPESDYHLEFSMPYYNLSRDLLALLRELHRFAPDAPLRPDTVYFGGGTPSLLTPAQAKRLIRAADPVPGAEITLEANPETVTEESLRGFRAAGVNRISFGVQSARDTQLRTLGRPHSAKQARAAFAAARRAGFENISGDIMLALPHYTQAEFDETLELIEKGGATHISAYLLKIEPDSAFGKHPPEGLPTSDEAADFYLYAVEQLEHHGYRQYEISNFAKPGYEGKHNLIYWDCGDYLGLGPAAHSCMGGKRFCYAPDTAAFLQDAAAPIMDGSCGAEDYLILQLRLRKGLDLEAYKTLYGKQFSTAQLAFVQNCVRAGYATFDGRILALTPAGLIVQNSILAQLL